MPRPRAAPEPRRTPQRRTAWRQGALPAVGALTLLSGVVTLGLWTGLSGVAHGSGATGPNPGSRSHTHARLTALHAPATPRDPLTTAAVESYIAARGGTVSVAVEDLDEPRGAGEYAEWVLDPGGRFQTASIVKADILETLLHQHHGPLAGSTAEAAEDMIEDSDNDDATELWNLAGHARGIAAYNRVAGLTQTTPNPDAWGETLTSAADQIKLLDQLALPSSVLTQASRAYELSLMEDIDPEQDWGVSAGVPSGVSVALKNGWVPLTSYTDWEVNSIGRVRGDGRWYLIAVLTAHDSSEQYGIDTIDHLSSLIFRDLKPS